MVIVCSYMTYVHLRLWANLLEYYSYTHLKCLACFGLKSNLGIGMVTTMHELFISCHMSAIVVTTKWMEEAWLFQPTCFNFQPRNLAVILRQFQSCFNQASFLYMGSKNPYKNRDMEIWPHASIIIIYVYNAWYPHPIMFGLDCCVVRELRIGQRVMEWQHVTMMISEQVVIY